MASRKREKAWAVTQEDVALDNIAQKAEAILQEKKKEREKARKMRMEELEKKHKEEEEQLDKQYELLQKVGPSVSSARIYGGAQPGPASSRGSSVDSDCDTKDLKVAFSELEEKYRRAMIGNSQLDNEKQAVSHLVDVLKDKLEDAEERCYELQREAQDKHKRLGEAKQMNRNLAFDLERFKLLLKCREELIGQYNLEVTDGESAVEPIAASQKGSGSVPTGVATTLVATDGENRSAVIVAAVVSSETADMLKLATPGTFDEKIRSFVMENVKLKAEIANVRRQMDEEQESRRPARLPAPAVVARSSSPVQMNGVTGSGVVSAEQLLEQQRESARVMVEYKTKVQKAELDLASLESSVVRLEMQVKRFKESAEEAEKAEDELKSDKRKLQKQLREAQLQIEELENQKQHLQNRLDKIRQARKEVLGN